MPPRAGVGLKPEHIDEVLATRPDIGFFEIHAENPERAAAFYTAVFGWKFQKWDGPMPYWLITTGTEAPGINGGMVPRHGPAPMQRFRQSPHVPLDSLGI